MIAVPDAEIGEQVKTVIQLEPRHSGSPEMAAGLICYVRDRVAYYKAPKSVDFVDDLRATRRTDSRISMYLTQSLHRGVQQRPDALFTIFGNHRAAGRRRLRRGRRTHPRGLPRADDRRLHR
ncbi:hypothetical protein [Nocardia arthritidis]|uniref:hypothetical protein n=1 Tax=Nocardia arthritidis TaxID=228602 RepID=UPI003D161117